MYVCTFESLKREKLQDREERILYWISSDKTCVKVIN